MLNHWKFNPLRNERFQIILGFILGILLLGLLFPISVFANGNGQETCPNGAGWTKIDSPDLSLYPVPGATDYCFKAGSDNSRGCIGGLFDSWPQPDGTCGLSHWSYFIGESDPTSTPVTPTQTPTDEPTLTPTDDPSETPEPTLTDEPSPTPTGDPCEEQCEPSPTPTPTDPGPDPTPPKLTELPNTGLAPWEWDQAVWQVDGYPNAFFTHNGDGGFGLNLVMLQRGSVFHWGTSDYEVTGILRVNPEDVWVLNLPADVIFVTCTGYNVNTGEWRYRLVIFMQEL